MIYNPFDKLPGDTLTAEELQKLVENNVAEGYYVEYKSQFVKNEKIGWSISSFANSYGGWYIVGVETDEHNVATHICGFDLFDCPDPISKIREIVKSHIDPQPIFYPQVIKLEENKAVFIVYIPENQDKPFICKNGRIYRRVADSSDPVHETNRYVIDKLYEEGKEVNQRFKDFCQDERIHDREHGWVKIFISPYPLGILDNDFELESYTSKSIDEIIELSKKQIKIPYFDIDITGNLPFNSGQTSFRSLIFRQSERLDEKSLEFELFQNLQAKIFIPLQYSEPWQSDIFANLSKPNQKIIKQLFFDSETRNKLLNKLFLFDVGKLYLLMVNLITFYTHVLSKNSHIYEVEVIIELENVWWHVPFFDCDKWAEYVVNSGLPVIQRKSKVICRKNGRGLLLELGENYDLWIPICSFVGNELGLPGELTSNIINESYARIAQVQN